VRHVLAKVAGAGRVGAPGGLARHDVPSLGAVLGAQRHGLDVRDPGRLDAGQDTGDTPGRLARRQQQGKQR
jgi:hypothetical protein